jgi:type I restriction enzyme M protein
LKRCEVHTLLRLPTGIWYSPGVKANVLFFDKKAEATKPATVDLWIYDLRSNQKFSLRHNQIKSEDLRDFVTSYCADDFAARRETPRFRRFTYDEIIAKDKASLDIQWADEVADVGEADSPQVLMRAILDDLQDALKHFSEAESHIKS